MPNRMFDPVSNPFAIQNLLEKKVETFVAQPDERADATFIFDSVAMANPVHAFREQTIEDPAGGEMHEFQADWMDAGNEFAAEETAAGDFVAAQTQAAAGFSADGDADAQGDAAVNAVADSDTSAQSVAGQGDAVASVAGAGAEAAAAAIAAEENTDAGAGAEAGAVSAAHASEASTEAGQAAMNERAPSDTDESAQDDVAAAATDAAMNAAGAAEAAQAAIAAEAAAAAAAAGGAPAVVAQPGISEEELQARLEAAREEGRDEVRGDAHESVRAEAHQQGYDEGQAAGYAQAKEALGKAYEEKVAQLQAMVNAMQELSYNPDAMFEPMKTLSVHIAEQLVRGELSQSPQAISRLVDNCLRELNASGEKAVVIHLHPEDLEQYKPQAAMFGDALVLRPDPKLERGSVRASLDGSVVDDLIQRRVAGLKKGLMQAPAPSWRANAGRLSERIAESQRGSQQVEDVTIATARQEADAKAEAVTESAVAADSADNANA